MPLSRVFRCVGRACASVGKRRSRGLAGTTVPIYVYNGGHRWTGPVEIRPLKVGNARYGPGFYTTNSLETARKYAKGGGVISRLTLDPLTLTRDVAWSKAHAVRFVKSIPKLRGRERVLEDLDRLYRPPEGAEPRSIGADRTLNLILAADPANGAGQVGVALAEAMVREGIDADIVQHFSETWVILYNPAKVVRREVVQPAGEGVEWELPSYPDLKKAGFTTETDEIPSAWIDDPKERRKFEREWVDSVRRKMPPRSR